jgi:acetylornithine/succinyldiaminopimelate/putrescine aminotransferase
MRIQTAGAAAIDSVAVIGPDGRGRRVARRTQPAEEREMAAGGRTPTDKAQVLDRARRFLFPDRVERLAALGVDLVIGRREGYRFWDLDGREFLDFHLNGGTYSLGHRHPELLEVLLDTLGFADVGNHHFANPARAELAERLAAATGLQYTVFTPSGAEAVDVAIKSARRCTKRRRIVALARGYHGRSGLSGAAGDDTAAADFHSDYPGEFPRVPFNDLAAIERVLGNGDVAAVLMETIPATSGFPIPEPGYLPGVRELCERHGSLYIADEVQTGLGRTGRLWGIDCWGVKPDILVTGKGLSGGLYPVSAAVLSRRAGSWLEQDGWGYVSTFGGAEPGCAVGCRALELCAGAATLENVASIASYLRDGLDALRARYPFFKGIRQQGLVMGLEFDAPDGGMRMTAALYQQGIWAMFAGFDRSVLQFKPGLLIDRAYCDEALGRFEDALRSLPGSTVR